MRRQVDAVQMDAQLAAHQDVQAVVINAGFEQGGAGGEDAVPALVEQVFQQADVDALEQAAAFQSGAQIGIDA